MKRKPLFHFDIQVDFHGLNAEEAIIKLEHLIFANPSSGIMLIHGRGKGVLRKKIREYLKNAKLVEKVEYGENINLPGSDGVTVVYT